ncbi:nucleoid-associated protein [Flavicella sediminum]|uniref:nucleoid-associated protein n=1 Tax=Flavicella sediminum TaxID=2585141 RepID=UPI00112034C3|nr:nucleoid-associated protein [Flavicella sediminum]
MIQTEETFISQTILHKIGNKHTEIDNFVSNNLLNTEDEDLYKLLFSMSLKPFGKINEFYNFTHSTHLSMNEMYTYCSEVFEDPNNFITNSKYIAQHLFEQSSHPQIKTGDLIVSYFSDIFIKGELVDAIGILKIEKRTAFFQTQKDGKDIFLEIDKGINPGKIDKGCLILNTEKENGFTVLSIDNNNYDATYWKEHFLNITYADDDNAQTKHFLDMCKTFSSTVVKEELGKQEQAEFLSTTVGYFSEKDVVSPKEFEETVFAHNDSIRNAFIEYKELFEDKKQIDFWDEFQVSNSVFESQKRKIKNEIKLDTHIQIKLDLENPASTKEYLEKGFDEEKQMHFYKVYFNNEL